MKTHIAFTAHARTLAALLACLAALASSSALVRPAATAERTVRLRVMSYNIHVGIGMDKQLDLARIAAVIREQRPDLVGLQEVDRGVERTKRVDQIAELARLTGMEYAFAHNLNYQGGQYGVAVLSRLPILAIDHRRYANLREAERRGLLRVEVSKDGTRLHFVNTHLDYQHADGRLFETQQLLAALPATEAPVIIAGDFNDEPTGTSYKLMLTRFADAWTECDERDDERRDGAPSGLTYPADKPAKRIDYVFFDKRRVRARRARVPVTTASDHLPLVVDLEIKAR
ncbi:MAG TPA: endonuclease/exonuclease/phosphatase family protein [Pyrinomonadaceae bacterium]|nr:endonuclease/exonuclease/phosphatase family protein [Pyrinomonadaceae bacterium]